MKNVNDFLAQFSAFMNVVFTLVPTKDLLAGFTHNSWEENMIIINGTHFAGTASDKYRLIQNEQSLLPVLNSVIAYVNQNHNGDFSKVKVQMHENEGSYFVKIHMQNELYGIGKDKIYKVIGWQNSANTQVKAKTYGMEGRLVCTNGLYRIVTTEYMVNVKHTSKDVDVINFDEIETSVMKYLNVDLNLAYKDRLNEVSIFDIDTDITKAYEAIIKGTLFPKKKIVDALAIARTEAAQLGQDLTVWLAYNSLNHVLNHDNTFKMKQQFRMDTDSKLYINTEKLVESLA